MPDDKPAPDEDYRQPERQAEDLDDAATIGGKRIKPRLDDEGVLDSSPETDEASEEAFDATGILGGVDLSDSEGGVEPPILDPFTGEELVTEVIPDPFTGEPLSFLVPADEESATPITPQEAFSDTLDVNPLDSYTEMPAGKWDQRDAADLTTGTSSDKETELNLWVADIKTSIENEDINISPNSVLVGYDKNDKLVMFLLVEVHENPEESGTYFQDKLEAFRSDIGMFATPYENFGYATDTEASLLVIPVYNGALAGGGCSDGCSGTSLDPLELNPGNHYDTWGPYDPGGDTYKETGWNITDGAGDSNCGLRLQIVEYVSLGSYGYEQVFYRNIRFDDCGTLVSVGNQIESTHISLDFPTSTHTHQESGGGETQAPTAGT